MLILKKLGLGAIFRGRLRGSVSSSLQLWAVAVVRSGHD